MLITSPIMNHLKIPGVYLQHLPVHRDDRGFLFEAMKDSWIERYGQTNITVSYPGVIKAFHWHQLQTDYWTVLQGDIQVVLWDGREDLESYDTLVTRVLSGNQPESLAIPPGVAHGYRVLGNVPAMLMYHVTHEYVPCQPDEYRIDWDDSRIGFDWETRPR